MTLWQERGGVPLATVVALLLAVIVGASVTVATYREQQSVPARIPAETPTPQTIELGDLAAELATALADELHLTPAQEHRVVRVITATGQGAVIVVPEQFAPSGSRTPPAATTTTVATTSTTTTTTMTQPPRPTIPRILGDLLDDYVYPTSTTTP